jgi:hypothetical protein
MTSTAVGWYAPEGAAPAAAEAAGVEVRFPRARPEPRVLPKAPNAAVSAWAAAGASVAARAEGAETGALGSAGLPDGTLSVIVLSSLGYVRDRRKGRRNDVYDCDGECE